MTPTQEKVYDFILRYEIRNGIVPTPQTTAKHFKISRQRVEMIYSRFIQLGKMKKKAVVSRYELCT